MKNILKLSALFCAAVLTIVGCQEELDTAQYSDSAVTLASFGPNPAMRGGTVTFYGSNLDKVVEVLVPGMSPITQIEVIESGKTSEIRVILDTEAPEIGYVTLKTADGKELKTKSELTYKEPIVFDGFVAKDVNFPGETITLKGTYMDLVKAVVFEGGEEVAVEEGATRHEAQVVIPATALTGVIILSDKAEIESLFYSEKELVMGEPTIVANAKATLKAGDAITFKGQHLEMIDKIIFDGAEVVDFTLAEDNKSISLTLPAEAKDGEFKAVSFAGKEYKAGEIVNVVPTIEKVAPEAVKAGNKLTITGKNLDLVTAASCDGVDALTFSNTDKGLEINISSKAKEGDLVLKTANGTEVKTALKLVHPTITSVAPAELFAGDEPVVVKGTDLDLAISATLGGKAIEIKDKKADELSLETTASSVSGKVVLTLDNGEKIESTSEVTMKYHALVIVSERPDGQHIGEVVTLKGENMNLVESVFIGTEKVTKYVIRKDDEISFIMPWLKVGMYDLNFVLYNGDTEKQPAPIEVLLEREIKTIFKGSQKVAWNDNDPWLDQPGNKALSSLAYGAFDWSTVKAGTTLMIYYNLIPEAGYAQMRVGNGSWSAIPCWLKYPGASASGEVNLSGNAISVVLKQEDIDALVAGNGMVICGHGYEITEVQLITEISQETTIWEGSAVADDWANQPYVLDDGAPEFAKNNVTAGTVIRFYVTPLESAWKLQIVDGHWGPTYASYCSVGSDTENGKFAEYDLDANGGCIALVLTDEIITACTTVGGWGGGFVLNGDNCKVTKITVQ